MDDRTNLTKIDPALFEYINIRVIHYNPENVFGEKRATREYFFRTTAEMDSFFVKFPIKPYCVCGQTLAILYKDILYPFQKHRFFRL
jgi:hypothetical protein